MRAHVHAEGVRLPEGLAADLAGVALVVVRVYHLVGPEQRVRREGLGAHVAAERPLARVRPQVLVQHELPGESLVADLTDVRLLARVGALVYG